jgi:FlaA1/EpsC-like NDP-sugar epimerase
METSPNEAVKNNVFGTLNVAKAADKFGTKRFILISTDKAVKDKYQAYLDAITAAEKAIANQHKAVEKKQETITALEAKLAEQKK